MSTTDQAERRKRVNLLKKLIMVFIFTIIMVPILLCVILSARLHNMEQDMKEIRQILEQISPQQSDREAASGGLSGSDPEAQEEAPIQAGQMTGQDSSADSVEEQAFPETDPTAEADMQTSKEEDNGSSEDGVTAEAVGVEDHLRKIYLTFDDGPSSYTDDILDILAAYDVKATFFVVGKEDETSKTLLKRIVDEGHSLGMHSYSHVYDDIYTSAEGFAGDLGKLQGYLYDVTGVTSKIYRFPGGSSNKVSSMDMRVFIKWLHEQGIEYYDWNISSGDANPVRLTVEQVLENCTKDLSKYRNAIILMHDAPGKKTTVEALPTLIEKILEMEDTVILPITEDTKPVQHITIKEETEDQ